MSFVKICKRNDHWSYNSIDHTGIVPQNAHDEDMNHILVHTALPSDVWNICIGQLSLLV